LFVRTQTNGSRTYLLIVDNQWVEGKVKQRVLFRLGRLDQLLAEGRLDALVQSLARFSEKLAVLGAQARGEGVAARSSRIGPALIFQRLWEACSIDQVLERLLRERRFEFPVERAIFLTVLHRLVSPGSDRAAEKWKDDYTIPGSGALELHQLYRAMAWLGEELFAQRRDLFSPLDLVFFDTTSIYFEGEGGQSIGQRGHSQDHRPDLKQMVGGVRMRSSTEAKAVVTAPREALRQGDKSLVGNRGYRKFLRSGGQQFAVDEDKVSEEARYDGKWVLTTNTDLAAREVALKYKQLWMVEAVFRSMKSLLDTRPIFHKCDETIRGHVFCSFLALVLRKELEDRLASKEWKLEWAELIRDLDNLLEMEVSITGKGYVFRSEAKGTTGKVFQACGVALPPVLRPC